MKDWRHLKGKRVVVTAGGLEYRGTVWELGEQTLVLRTTGGHQEISWERVTGIREQSGTTARPRGPSILG